MKPRDDSPMAVRSVDIAEPLRPITDVSGYPCTRIFVFDRGALIGSTDIPNIRRPISAMRLRDAIAGGLSYVLLKRALERQLAVASPRALPPDVPVSIVIPTCHRPDDLRRCLAALRAQRLSRRCE